MRYARVTDRLGCRADGFTLVEVLAALAVLIIGMSAILGVLYATYQNSQTAADRDAAVLLIPEAVRQIAQEHLITQETATKHGIEAGKVGLYVQTVTTAPENDETSPYRGIEVGCLFYNPSEIPPPPNPPTVTLVPPNELLGKGLNEWPRRPARPMKIGGNCYRVHYRLETHLDQVNYDGMYALTVVCYRDSKMDASELVQIADPVTVYLRKRG